MKHQLPAPLVRFHVHMLRDHATQLVALANALAKRKGRDTRLGEALELALVAGLSKSLADLLDLAQDDKDAPHWLKLGPVNRMGGKALTPAELSR
ncbi:hypothetical protein [Pseudomonas wenzhouensis]|uniref:hypothetical protein n=1 Tax=Pseudomonas wenzhouensis TaxID=2906062 RepID=UPI001E37DDD3|nr:hypothetical protein [Pseudomonas wenzhouensis]UFQ96757.1 hypothetical protein J7655_15845 [Pseudomonas wenzhouensis]